MKKSGIDLLLILGIIIAVVFLFVEVSELYDVVSTPDDYRALYDISANSPHLQFRSLNNYIIWICINVLGIATYIVISLYFYKNRERKKLLLFIIIVDVCWIILLIRYQILYVNSGYDHYPGFDPFLT